MDFLERYFKLSQAGTTVKTEITAGVTTFMTMAYILAVNPSILSQCGMDASAVFGATAISAFVATVLMAFLANLPIALAAGMGLNAFLTYTVVLGMKHSWQFALTAVFIEGIIFIILSLSNVREAIINSIPLPLKKAISAGIGLFIAFIGLQSSGICINNDATLVTLGSLTTPGVIVSIVGIVAAATLMIYKVKGALLLGILIATVVGIPLGVTNISAFNASNLFKFPDISPTFCQFEFDKLFTYDMLIVLLTFLFADIFDTAGTLTGVATKGNMLDKNGKLPNAKGAFLADAIGTTFGALLGTSTVTSYVESSAGVIEGGRTGLTALTAAVLFLLSLFLAPIFLLVPSQATAAALILVGFAMITPIADLDFSDYVYSIPAFLCMIAMPLTYSIANGIYFCFIAYVVLAVIAGRRKELSNLSIGIALVFLIRFMLI